MYCSILPRYWPVFEAGHSLPAAAPAPCKIVEKDKAHITQGLCVHMLSR